MKKQFNLGIIGLGDISDVYINNLKQYDIVHILACASRGLEKAERKAEQHGITRPYADGHDLIADLDIDIVLNLTTPAAHAEYNLAAIQAGKHLYTEKPLASTYKEAREIMSAAAEHGRSVGSAPDTFLGGRLQTCREIIDAGTIGEITAASAFVVSPGHEWHHPSPAFFYQPGAGPLLDIGPYYVIALLSLIGPAVSCCAMGKQTFATRTARCEPTVGESIRVHPDVDTHISATIEFASGAIGTIITSFDVWDSELPRIEIYGTRGTICIRDVDPISGPNLFGGPLLLQTAQTSRWRGVPRPEPLGDWTEVPVTRRFSETGHDKNSRGIGLVEMAYAIRDGRPVRAGGEMALHSVELMEAILDSAKTRRFVDLETSFARPQPLPVDFPESEER